MSDTPPQPTQHSRRVIGLKRPLLLYSVNMWPLSSLTVSVSFSLSCVSQSLVLFYFPYLVQAYMSNRPVKEKGDLLHGSPGVVADGEAVSVVLCIQWKEQGQQGVACIIWATSLITTLLFLQPLSPCFHDPWNALGGYRNSRWVTGGAPNTSFLHFLPEFFVYFSPQDRSKGFLQKAAWAVLSLFTLRARPSCMFGETVQVETVFPPPTLLCFSKKKSPPAALHLWRERNERERCGSKKLIEEAPKNIVGVAN